MLNLTSSAAAQILRSVAEGGAADHALRVAARRESDGTVTFGMGFDEPREGDMPLQIQGVNLVIALSSQPMLQDVVLDFVEIEPGSFNFIFATEETASEKPAKACATGACDGCAT